MKNLHLSEKEIQDMALEKTEPDLLSEHVAHCLTCKTKVETYRLIFGELQHTTVPVFDFEVALPRMTRQRKTSSNYLYIFILASALIVFMLLAIAITGSLVNLQSDKSAQTISQINWLIVLAASVLLLGLLADTAVGYHKKINAINRSVMQHYSIPHF